MMGKIFKLQRPIRNAADTEDIDKITMKDEKDISACDFYGVSFGQDGKTQLGLMAETIANLCGITESQVASLHIKDYLKISGEVSNFLE